MSQSTKPDQQPPVPFSALPLTLSGPPWSAWGAHGAADELGTANRLSSATVRAAAAGEIHTGERFSLNLPLDALGKSTLINRQPFELRQWNKAPRIVNDDVWTFNSQGSTQWDGLRHFGYQKEQVFYGGRTLDDFFEPDGRTIKSHVNGIDRWEKQGIVGRGVLVDFASWAAETGREYKSLPTTREDEVGSFSLRDILDVLAWQGTEVKYGDILLLRTGMTKAYEALDDGAKADMAHATMLSGLEPSVELLEWMWNHLAAIAADNVGIERWPSTKGFLLHEIALSGWGMPFGEFFYLEKLAEHCKKINRWSFFFVSEPCNVPGAVASPPNALAIF